MSGQRKAYLVHEVREAEARAREAIANANAAQLTAEAESARLREMVESFEVWQRSWGRRTMGRWRFTADGNGGFFKRMVRSVQKRLASKAKEPPPGPPGDQDQEAPLPPPANPTCPTLKDECLKEACRRLRARELADFLSSDEEICFAAAEKPTVSVVVVLFNQAGCTLACLRALAAMQDPSLEIVIVDNASSDETSALLRRVRGATLLRNEENVGYLKAVNQGVLATRGRYVLLLNNDAVPRLGALPYALETLTSGGGVAAVGGRLVLPDGTLQEAGSIVWADGICEGYGRGRPEDAFECMFRRDVDYCSAAFLLVNRDTFEEVGWFDEGFAPAYCEDVDLCLRFAEAGLRVVLDPRVVVDHFEFASSSTVDEALRQQLASGEKLRKKHAELLAQQWPRDPAHVLRSRDRRKFSGRILFLDDLVPVPDRGGGCPRALEILRVLDRAGYFVTFWPMRQIEETWEITWKVVPPGIEVVLGLGAADLPSFLADRLGFYDHLIVSRPHNMVSVDHLLRHAPGLLHGLRIVYDAEAVYALRDIRRSELVGEPLREKPAAECLQEELALAGSADVVAVTSPSEAAVFRQAGFNHVHCVAHCLTPAPTPAAFEDRCGFLFVGRLRENDSPNAESLMWFLLKVWPRIRQELGEEAVLRVAGPMEGSFLGLFSSPDVQFLGKVETLTSLYNAARVFVVPTRFAAGIPLKACEAAAHGLPLCMTGLIASQLEWTHGNQTLVADSPEAFAEACLRLYRDKTLWTGLRERALEAVRRDLSPETFQARVLSLLSAGESH